MQSRGREDTDDAQDNGRHPRGKEAKGNVIVSVRVRPDASSQESSQADGEWMVDSRRSLVAYRGREGGDYHYGKFELKPEYAILIVTQTMFLPPMIIMPESTILRQKGWYDESWRAIMALFLLMV